jgi:positive regulator of sigma E activity
VIDDGVVVSADGLTARVKVGPKTACCSCSARTFCQGQKGEDGTLLAMNPLQARSGDIVTVDIPEEAYAAAAIRLFGGLLLAVLLGFGLGTLVGGLIHLPASAAGFAGLLLGLAAGGFSLYRSFGRSGRQKIYPIVSSILKKGDVHG